MKKILSLFLALSLLAMLCVCGGETTPSNNPGNSQPGNTQSEAPNPGNDNPGNDNPGNDNPGNDNPGNDNPGNDNPPVNPGNGGPTDLDFASEVTALEGTWNLVQVFVDGETADATAGALTFKVTKELDPSELVDGPNYIHNQVYNFTGVLTFGLDSIVAQLADEDIDSYKGNTSWEDFPQGKVVAEGQFYEQPGPATMRFKDIDEFGLFLEEIAGIGGDLDTTEKTLIIGLNADGQLLLGYSNEHIERPGTSGEWEYVLIFTK